MGNHLDFSNLAEDNSLFSNENKAVLGKFKDEAGGIPLWEYSEHLYRLRSHFDFSSLAEDNPLFSNENKAVLGKFKDEAGGIPLWEYSQHVYRLRNHFDFSTLAEDNPLFSNENKAVVGKFKEEAGGIPLWEFIGKITYNFDILKHLQSDCIANLKSIDKFHHLSMLQQLIF